MSELRKKLPAYAALSDDEKILFVRAHYRFLQGVYDNLKRAKKPFSHATISRTWYGQFRVPNSIVMAALDRAYLRAIDGDAEMEPAEEAASAKAVA